ncbi:hypothetical protein J1614_007544 [Plenodomus biglobosus]|nr:hypothetical protein J1614_007544 [Plenodomus biglobosus]
MQKSGKTSNTITQASGVFANCGPGTNTYALQYSCGGSACESINGFQNVKCNSDGGRMLCSNSVKCPSGIASFISNFTFTQNDGDPWSPTSLNERDSLVQQEQHITVAECAKFSLLSNGTVEETRIDGGSMANDKECPKVRETPSATAHAEAAEKPVSTAEHGTSFTNKPGPELIKISLGSRRRVPRTTWFLTLLVSLMILLPSSYASEHHERRLGLLQRTHLRVRDASNRVSSFAEDFSADLAAKANALGPNGDTLARNLVADVVSSVCTAYFDGDDTGSFAPAIFEDCIKNVYGGGRLPQAAAQFYVIFGASLLCDVVISEAYPVAQEFVTDGCEGLGKLAKKASPSAMTPPSLQVEALVAKPSNAVSSLDTLATSSPPSFPSSISVRPSDLPSSVVQSLRASSLDGPTLGNIPSAMSIQSGLSLSVIIPPPQSRTESQSLVYTVSLATSDDPKVNTNAPTPITPDPGSGSSGPSSTQATIDIQDPSIIPNVSGLPNSPGISPTLASTLVALGSLMESPGPSATAVLPSSAGRTSLLFASNTPPSSPTRIASDSVHRTSDLALGIPAIDLPIVQPTTSRLKDDPVDDPRTLLSSIMTPTGVWISPAGPLSSPTTLNPIRSQTQQTRRTDLPAPLTPSYEDVTMLSTSLDPSQSPASTTVSLPAPELPTSSLNATRSSSESASSLLINTSSVDSATRTSPPRTSDPSNGTVPLASPSTSPVPISPPLPSDATPAPSTPEASPTSLSRPTGLALVATSHASDNTPTESPGVALSTIPAPATTNSSIVSDALDSSHQVPSAATMETPTTASWASTTRRSSTSARPFWEGEGVSHIRGSTASLDRESVPTDSPGDNVEGSSALMDSTLMSEQEDVSTATATPTPIILPSETHILTIKTASTTHSSPPTSQFHSQSQFCHPHSNSICTGTCWTPCQSSCVDGWCVSMSGTTASMLMPISTPISTPTREEEEEPRPTETGQWGPLVFSAWILRGLGGMV